MTKTSVESKEPALSGIQRAVSEGGGLTPFAARLGVTYQVVQHWLKQGYAPSRYAVEIEATTGVPRRELINPRLADLLVSRLGED